MRFEIQQAPHPANCRNEVHRDESTIRQFLAASRRYFGLARSRLSGRAAGGRHVPKIFPIHLSLKKAKKMTSCRTLVSSVLFASTLGLGAVSSASAHPGAGPYGGYGEFGKHRAERMEQRHQQLHGALKLTPEQEGAWKKLMESERPMARGDASRREDWAKLSTPERAEKMLERMREHQALMTEHVAALKEFYGQLTPEQRKTFDDFHANPRGGMRGKSGPRSPSPEAAPQKP